MFRMYIFACIASSTFKESTYNQWQLWITMNVKNIQALWQTYSNETRKIEERIVTAVYF